MPSFDPRTDPSPRRSSAIGRTSELVFAGADKPVIEFEVRFGSASGEALAPVSYHLEVEFGKEAIVPDDRRTRPTMATPFGFMDHFTGLDWDFSAAGSESRPRARSVHRDRRADWECEPVSIRPQIDGNPRRD